MVHPIIDQYYNSNPNYVRSAAFARAKGLSVNEKSTLSARMASPLPTAPSQDLAPEAAVARKPAAHHPVPGPGPTIPFSKLRSRTPETASLSGSGLGSVGRARALASMPEPPPAGLRAVTEPPPLVRQASAQQPPEQGNIKKKRRSLNQLDDVALPIQVAAQQAPEPEPSRTEYGNPNKIARFFPELTLSR